MISPHLLARFGFGALLSVLFSAKATYALEQMQATSRAAAVQQIEFDVFLPLTNRAQLDQLLIDQQTEGSVNYQQWITPEQFRQRFGPKQSDVARVAAELRRYGFFVTQVHGHGIRVQGPASSVESAFSTTLWNGVSKQGLRRVISQQPLILPSVLAQAGAQVPAFSPIIRNRVHSKTVAQVDPATLNPDNRYTPIGGYWFTDLKQAYDFPSYEALTGKGVGVGIVMSSDYSASDMALYFGHEKFLSPKISRRPVLGGAPYDPVNNDGTFEVSLDIQQVGGMAPGAAITLYNIPDLSDSAIFAGYIAVLEDNQVDIVSSSFGGFEAQYFPEYNGGTSYTSILTLYDDLFKQGNAQGITWVASSGDYGGLGQPPLEYLTTAPTNPPTVIGYMLPGVESPASSPHVTAVGGTNLVTTYSSTTLQSSYVRENADGDPLVPFDPYGTGNLVGGGYWGSGGGISQFYLKPGYQTLVRTGSGKFRTVPDVSLHMGGCPGGIAYTPCGPDRSYVLAAVGGKFYGLIGTSASAPDFAGLLALREQFVPGRIGNANPYIYKLAASQFAGTSPVTYFHEKIPGFNGYYQAKKNYDLVIGVGTVFGKEFIGASALPPAGDPQTPSNP